MFNLYENIKKLCREKKNVTPSKMLVDLGMSKSTLSNLNNGRSESITTDTAEKFAIPLSSTTRKVPESLVLPGFFLVFKPFFGSVCIAKLSTF